MDVVGRDTGPFGAAGADQIADLVDEESGARLGVGGGGPMTVFRTAGPDEGVAIFGEKSYRRSSLTASDMPAASRHT